MQEWLLSIAGVVCLGLLLEIVMPEGQTTKYVRGAFSLLVIFVVVAPLPSFFKNGAKLELGEIAISTDESYLSSIGERLADEKENYLEKALSDMGYDTDVTVTIGENLTDIVEADVKIYFSGLDEENANKHIMTVRKFVGEKLGVSDSVVTAEIYGSR